MSAKTRGPACGDRPSECDKGADDATWDAMRRNGGAA